MSIIAATLGRLMPQHRTLAQWAAEYDKQLLAMPVKPKTLYAHRLEVQRLLALLGPDMRIGAVRPSHVARAIHEIHHDSPMTARRTLMEARLFFRAAIIEGWIDTNPADPIKHLPAPVARKRMSLSEWQATYAYARTMRPRWVQHMLLLALVSGQRRADLQKMRFDDVWDGYLHIVQQKTSARIALPLALRLDAIGVTLGEVIDGCRNYARPGPTLLRKPGGGELVCASLSTTFRDAYRGAHGEWSGPGDPPSLHECRSLAERLYREQGIDTQRLLGHARQSMTDQYNNDRGLTRNEWKRLSLPDNLPP